MKVTLALLTVWATVSIICSSLVYANPDVNPPTNFTATDNGANSVTLSWTLGTGSTNTTVICKREVAPAGRTDGEEIYTGNGTSYVHTGLALETTEYYYHAWGWESVEGYSVDYAEIAIGGVGMEEVATGITGLSQNVQLLASVLFNLAFLGIALWRREMFVYLIAAPVAIVFGWYWAETYLVAGIGFATIGGYCIYLAIMNLIRR